MLLLAAAVSLAAAVVANWLGVPWKWGNGAVRARVPPPAKAPLPGIATGIGELPGSIPGFETIARQAVPGRGGHAVEALYVTLNMNLEAQVPIAVYVRAEGYGSDALASQRAGEAMKSFTSSASKVRIGKLGVGKAGYTPDRGAYGVAWTRGNYMFFVKSAFRDKVPAEKREFLIGQARPVVNAIDAYQRTGKRSMKL